MIFSLPYVAPSGETEARDTMLSAAVAVLILFHTLPGSLAGVSRHPPSAQCSLPTSCKPPRTTWSRTGLSEELQFLNLSHPRNAATTSPHRVIAVFVFRSEVSSSHNEACSPKAVEAALGIQAENTPALSAGMPRGGEVGCAVLDFLQLRALEFRVHHGKPLILSL